MGTLLQDIVKQADGDSKVLAVILFGSTARGDRRDTSDVDVCLVLQPSRYSPEVLMEIRLQYLAAFAADIQIFQQLPIYLRQRVLKEGKVLCCKDQDALYNIALRTVQAFADFKPLYDRYLDEVARDRP
jgi:predicted nucleotidyltransferase